MSVNMQPYNHTIIPIIVFSLLILPALSFTSCSDKNIDHQKFIDTYVDLRIAEDTITTGDEDIQQLKAEILKKHGMTEAQYQSAFDDYNKNPELWEQFYDEAIARVDTLKKMKK